MTVKMKEYEVQVKETTIYIYKLKAPSPKAARSLALGSVPYATRDGGQVINVKKVQKGQKS